MFRSLAPNRSWGCSRVLIALALVGLGPQAVWSQASDTKKGEPAKKGDTEKGAPKGETGKAAAPGQAAPDSPKALPPLNTPAEQEQAGVVDPSAAKKKTRVEIFQDPRTEPTLAVDKFTPLPAVRNAPSAKEIKDMATGAANSNRAQIEEFVKAQAAALTNRNNLKALFDTGENVRFTAAVMKEFDKAATALMEPLSMAPNAVNTQFRKDYVAALLSTMPKLLNNHLYARTEAMIVLATTGDPEALPIFTAQLKDPDQVLAVKLWAARGITNATQNGRRDLDQGRANAAAKALSDFLQSEADAPWPVQMRALEALGSLRFATDAQGRGMAEMATAALRFVADSDATPDVRAYGAWALGMMKTSQVPGFNYPLAAYHIGQATVDLAEGVDSSISESTERATHLAGLILYRLLPALRGEEGVRESGLLNSSGLGGPARKNLTDMATRMQAVSVAAFNVVSTALPKSTFDSRKKELNAKVAALKDYLAKNKPSDTRLVPGGAEFAAVHGKVAGIGAR